MIIKLKRFSSNLCHQLLISNKQAFSNIQQNQSDQLEKIHEENEQQYKSIQKYMKNISDYQGGTVPNSYIMRIIQSMLHLDSPLFQQKLKQNAQFYDLKNNLQANANNINDIQDLLSLLEYQMIYEITNVKFKLSILAQLNKHILTNNLQKQQISLEQLSFLSTHIIENKEIIREKRLDYSNIITFYTQKLSEQKDKIAFPSLISSLYSLQLLIFNHEQTVIPYDPSSQLCPTLIPILIPFHLESNYTLLPENTLVTALHINHLISYTHPNYIQFILERIEQQLKFIDTQPFLQLVNILYHQQNYSVSLWVQIEEEIMTRLHSFSIDILVQLIYILNMAFRADYDLLKQLERQILFHKNTLNVTQITDLFYSAALRNYQSDKLFSSLLPIIQKNYQKMSPLEMMQLVYSQVQMGHLDYYLFKDMEGTIQMFVMDDQYDIDQICVLAYSISKIEFETEIEYDVVKALKEFSLESICNSNQQNIVFLLNFIINRERMDIFENDQLIEMIGQSIQQSDFQLLNQLIESMSIDQQHNFLQNDQIQQELKQKVQAMDLKQDQMNSIQFKLKSLNVNPVFLLN